MCTNCLLFLSVSVPIHRFVILSYMFHYEAQIYKMYPSHCTNCMEIFYDILNIVIMLKLLTLLKLQH
jgi:hypothetical protein